MTAPARCAELQLELAPLARPQMQCNRVPSVAQLDAVGQAQVEIEAVDRCRGLDDDARADLVVLEPAASASRNGAVSATSSGRAKTSAESSPAPDRPA